MALFPKYTRHKKYYRVCADNVHSSLVKSLPGILFCAPKSFACFTTNTFENFLGSQYPEDGHTFCRQFHSAQFHRKLKTETVAASRERTTSKTAVETDDKMQEKEKWHRELLRAILAGDWESLRAVKAAKKATMREADLTSKAEWQDQLQQHFRGIFAKQQAQQVRQDTHADIAQRAKRGNARRHLTNPFLQRSYACAQEHGRKEH